MKMPRFYKRGPTYYHASRDGSRWTGLGRNRAEAERKWHEVEQGAATSSVAALLLAYSKTLDDRLAPVTRREYRRSIDALTLAMGHIPARSLKPQHVGQYLDAKANTQSNRDIAVLSVAYAHAMRIGMVDRNPATGVRRNKEKRRKRYITPDEFLALKRAAGRHAASLDLAYLTALRVSDLLRLRKDNCTEEGIAISVEKTKSSTVMVWSDWLRQTVQWLAENHHGPTLIATQTGTPYTRDGFLTEWAKIRARSGVEGVTFHDIRGTSATDYARQHGTEAAKELLAHASLTTSERYIRARASHRVAPAG